MSRRNGAILLPAFAALFVAVNHGAYSGWFQDDEIDNLSWARLLSPVDFLQGVLSPFFYPNNFRPVAHFYFHAVERVAGLDFPVYVGVIHTLHVINVWLLWLVMRRLGAVPVAAAAACFFFGLHMALFDTFWKPMYVFDVLCATFCLGSLLLWMRDKWAWSLLCFWLAYKCKELAVMLPAVFLVLEATAPSRSRLVRLLPFLAISLWFGIQGMLRNPNHDNDYTFRFTLAALAETLPFYACRIFLIPYLGFLVLLLARNRRTWFGLGMMALFFLPLLFLPGRMFSAYCYLPFAGLAIALSGLNAPALVVMVLLWLPMDLHQLRIRQRETLARDADIRMWMSAAERFADSREKVDAFVFSGAPAEFHQWGVEGALKYFYGRNDLIVKWAEDPQAKELMAAKRVALIEWDAARRRADIRVVGPR